MAYGDKCKCYYEVEEIHPYPKQRITKKVGHCSGTKECEVCTCGGDRRICDFYDYVRTNADYFEETPAETTEAINKRESDLQPEFLKVAVDGLIKFRHAYCYNREESEKTDDLTFRCSNCTFSRPDGFCTIKMFIKNHATSQQKKDSEVLAR